METSSQVCPIHSALQIGPCYLGMFEIVSVFIVPQFQLNQLLICIYLSRLGLIIFESGYVCFPQILENFFQILPGLHPLYLELMEDAHGIFLFSFMSLNLFVI